MPSRNVIEIVIQGEDKASSVITNVNDSLNTLGSLALGAVAAGGAAASAAIVGFGAKALSEFSTFQQGMAEVFTLLPGISQDAMDNLEGQVQYLSQVYGKLPEEVIPAVYQAISAGVPSDNIFQFMQIATKASIAGVTSLETAVDGITSVVNAYGADVIDASKASDIMFTAVRLGKTDFGQLSSALFNVIPTASSLGVKFEDVAAGLAAITAQGTPTSVATTQMRQLFVELQKPTSEASKLFEKMAGESFPDFIQQGGNLADALGLIEKGAQESGKDLTEVFGSVEALNAFLGLTGTNTERYVGFLEEMGNAAGSTDAAFETMSHTIQFQSNRLQSKLSNLFINVGRKLEPFASAAVEQIGDVVSVFDDFLTGDMADGGDFTGLARTIFDALSPLKPLFDTITGAVSGFFEAVQSGVPFVEALKENFYNILPQELQTGLKQVYEAITSIGDTIGQIIAPIIDWVKNNVQLKDVLIAVGIAVASVVIPALIGLIGVIGTFAAPIAAIIVAIALLRTAWENDFGGIRTFITEQVLPKLQELADWFTTDALPTVISFIETTVIPLFNDLTTKINDIWTTVQPGLESLANWFTTDALPTVVSFVNDTVMPAITDFINLVSGIWDTVSTGLGLFLDWFITSGLPIIMTWVDNAKTSIDNIITVIETIWTTVQPALSSLADWFLETALPDIVAFMTDTVKPLFDDFVNLLSGIWDTVSSALGSFFDWFTSTGLPIAINWINLAKTGFDNVIGVIKTLWTIAQPYLEAFKTGIQTIFDFIKNNIIQPVIDAINSIPETIKRIKEEVDRIVGEILSAINSINLNPFTGSGFLADTPLGYANGLEYVDRDRIVKVHRGEAILTAEENAARNNGVNTQTNYINISLAGNYRSQADANNDVDMFVTALRLKGLDLTGA